MVHSTGSFTLEQRAARRSPLWGELLAGEAKSKGGMRRQPPPKKKQASAERRPTRGRGRTPGVGKIGHDPRIGSWSCGSPGREVAIHPRRLLSTSAQLPLLGYRGGRCEGVRGPGRRCYSGRCCGGAAVRRCCVSWLREKATRARKRREGARLFSVSTCRVTGEARGVTWIWNRVRRGLLRRLELSSPEGFP